MNYLNFNIDIAIFIIFLALNLVVGLNYGRGVKTIKDYALGGRNFSTGALVATIVATWVSGSSFFIILSKTYSDGIVFTLAACCRSIDLLIVAFVLIPRMSEFLGDTSIGESIGKIYGDKARFITALAGIVGAIGGIAVQFRAFGNIFHYFAGLSSINAIIVAGVVVTLYSALGGVRAITYTDILQFITFGFAIPMIGVIIWSQINDFDIFTAFSKPLFNYQQAFSTNNPKFIDMLLMMIYFVIPGMGPSAYQRIMVGRNIEQVKKAFIISAVILIFITLALSWIPFLIFSINPNLKPDNILSYIINNYTYTGLRGLIIVGVTAMAMSTADAYINASSILFANDICKPLKLKFSELYLLRFFAFAIGAVAILLALWGGDILNVVLTANAFYLPIVTVPLLLTIFGFRTSSKSVLTGMTAGFTTVVVWKTIGIKADVIIFAMLMNLIFLVGSHYVLKQPGGWIKNEHKSKSIKERLVNYINKLKERAQNFNLLEFFKKYSPKSELTYMSFGIYCIFYTLTTIYSTQNKFFGSDSKVLLYIYQIMLCTSVVMAMYPIWPPRIKHEIIVQTTWNFVVFYMLVFFSGFLVLISGFSQLQFVVFTLNMVIVAMLTSWRQALIMMVLGFYASVQFYKYYVGLHDHLDVVFGPPQHVLMYALVLIGSAFVVFFRPREYEQALAQEKVDHLNTRIQHREEELGKAYELKNEFLRNISHEVRTPMVGITSLGPLMYEMYDKLEPEKVKSYLKDIADNSKRLESLMFNILDLSSLTSLSAKLECKLVNLSDLVKERALTCSKLYLYGKDMDLDLDIEDNLIISCDEYYIKQTIDNLIINAINYGKDSSITISLRAVRLNQNSNFTEVEFSIQDQGIGIPPSELYDIFGSFIVSSKTHTLAGGRGVGLALCKKVIDLHKGKIKAQSDGKQGATFIFNIPRRLELTQQAITNSEPEPKLIEKLSLSSSYVKKFLEDKGVDAQTINELIKNSS